ncbi:hypothetical protein F5X98DRAFT_324823 [Xylaria grammica]|nr:hypothetical protein F5X98DRAFT_324823 [Xylaria grammica]
MPHSSSSYRSSHSTPASSRPSSYQQSVAITSIPGRCIHPSKLGDMLQARFGDNYSVEMRADNYTIRASSRISYADIKACY